MTACISNRNGVVASCASVADLTNSGGLDAAKLQQLTTVSNVGTGTAMNAPANENTINFGFSSKCKPDASGAEGSTSTRQGAVVYRLETTGATTYKCVDV
jgi:hypothetical protein